MDVQCIECGKKLNLAKPPQGDYICIQCRRGTVEPQADSLAAWPKKRAEAEARWHDRELTLPLFGGIALLCMVLGMGMGLWRQRSVNPTAMFIDGIMGVFLFVWFLTVAFVFRIAGSAVNPMYTPLWKCAVISLIVLALGIIAAPILSQVLHGWDRVNSSLALTVVFASYIITTICAKFILRVTPCRAMAIAFPGIVFAIVIAYLMVLVLALVVVPALVRTIGTIPA